MSRQRALVTARTAVPVLSGVAAVAAVLAEVGAPVQPVLVLWFVLVCPGLALVGLVRPRSPLFALTLSIAVSCALAVVVAQALLFAGTWSPVAGLVVLAALTTTAVGVDLLGVRRGAHPPADAAMGGRR